MSALRLEVFEVASPHSTSSAMTLEQGAFEEAKLASYEQGYSAGWDDAATAQSADQARMRADIARNLQSLGFTFQEARAHVLRAIEPLLTEMVGRLLPATARATLAPIVLEALLPMAESRSETPVTLVLNPASREAVESFVGASTGLPIVIAEEPTLGEGQVYLRLGDVEARVDLDAAILDITTAVRGFYTLIEEDRKYG
jgi:flagellar biosynthesis/type III secretory pathway protein FliH